VANDNDDILDPAEIEALLNSAGGGNLPPPAPPTASAAAGAAKPAASQTNQPQTKQPPTKQPAKQTTTAAMAGQPMSAGDIDSLLRQHSRGPSASDPAALLEQATAQLAAAVDPQTGYVGGNVDRTAAPLPFEFQPFDQGSGTDTPAELSNLKDVELDLRIELGRTELLIEEVLKLREGSVVALDKLAGDPVDILVNGRLVARGEVLVLNDNFCVRVAEILAPALI
jgi:flagellar motor switch protein FliN/FliY